MSYNTKQYTLVSDYMKAHAGEHLTAEQIADELKENVSRTTVYRQLDRLVSEGLAVRYQVPGGQSACFRYLSEDSGCHEHYHLKCSRCGELIHCDCEFLDRLCGHIKEEHGFSVDAASTVLYGLCSKCREGKE